MNLQQGAFGDPKNIETLIMFWNMMAGQHYPFAAEVKEQLEQQRMNQMQMQQMPMQGFAPESDMPTDQAVPGNMNMMGGLNNAL